MTGGRITQNEAETGGAGVYVAEGSSVVFNGASAGGNFVIRENYLRGGQEGCENNLYFAEDATAELSGSMAGADIGVTCEDDYYGRVVFRPGGQNTISASDESAFVYDGGFYDIRLDSFVGKGENLILWHWTVGVEIIGDHITSSNDAEETPADLDYETTILPEEGYRLPERIHVTTGDKTLGEEEYVWEPETGKILIESEKIEGDIVIRIDADGLHQVSVECSNVSADLSSAAVTQKEEISVRFTRVPKYGLPLKEDVVVQGKCSPEYDEERGVLTVRNVTEDIVIRACGSKISHTVTFDPDGGRLEEGEESKEFFESDPTLGELPEPEKPGYHFDGWFDPEGNRVTEDTPNDNEDDITLKAHWSARTDISYTIRHYVELVDSGVNPETESTDETAVSVADKDGKVHVYYLYTVSEYHDGVADSVQSMNDHLMDCSEASMNTLSIEGFVLADFNQYEYRIEPDGSTVIDWYYDRADITVSYDGNGGTASQAQTSVKYGSCYGTLASADREGYTFDGWYTEANSGSQVTPEKICTSTQPVTLYAHWKAKGDTPYTVYHRTQNLTNNIVEENHDLSNTTLIQTDTLYGTSDCIVDLYGMAVDGFQCCPDNLYQVYINADGTASAVLYYDRAFTMVSYDANGGKTLSDEELKTKVYYGGVLGTVQAQPQREGYRFTGWYTEADGGRKVDADTGYDRIAPNGEKEVTLYAHWETNGGGSSPDPDPPAESGSSGGGGSGGGTQKKPLLTGEHIKYMQGYPDGTFRADGNMTRAEAAQMFYNLLNEKIVAPCFYKDVSASAWYADAAGALSELEIIEGYDDGSFRPDAEITRAEFVAMASRFFETEPDAECGFSDVKTDGWYYVVIASATEKGWLTGYSDGTFRPENKISRAEVAAVTNRVLERSADEDYLQKASEDDELNRELKLFPDLREGHWAYYTVLEAANAHDYERSETGEEFWTGLKA